MKTVLLSLLVLPFYLFGGEPVTILHQNGVFYLNHEPLIQKAAGLPSDKKAYWKYHWEFGDNQYYLPTAGRGERVKHDYARPGDYSVKVYLTPYYSNRRDTLIQRTFRISVGTPVTTESILNNGKLIDIKTNVDDELIPGANIRLILHFKVPKNGPHPTHGRLMIGFNDPAELYHAGLKFLPLAMDGKGDLSPVNTTILPDSNSRRFREYLGHGNRMVYGFSKLQGGEERRLFLTVRASHDLIKAMEKLKSKRAVKTSINAIWVPDNEKFNPITMKASYTLTILPVHDPNRIRVDLREATFFPKGQPELEYTVQFENNAEGIVRKMEISIPWDRTLISGKVKLIKMDPEVMVCSSEHEHDKFPTGCLEVDSSSANYGGQMRFIFHNIYLSGTKTEGTKNKYAKGKIVFTVPRNNQRKDQTDLQATIKFIGGNTEKTNHARTDWRYKTLGLKFGYNVNPTLKGFADAADLENSFPLGLWYQNMPLKSGLGIALEAQYLPLQFEGYSIQRLNQSQVFREGAVMATRDFIELKNLDLNVFLKYQIGGVFSVGVNAGIVMPVVGQGRTSSIAYTMSDVIKRYNVDIDDILEFDPADVYADFNEDGFGKSTTFNSLQRFGWTQKAVDENWMGQSTDSSRPLGFSGGIALEAGLGGDIMAGYRQQFRYLPASYYNQCMSVMSAEVYLKIRMVRFR